MSTLEIERSPAWIIENRVLLAAPVGRDAQLMSEFLTRSDMVIEVCPSLMTLCRELEQGAGAIIVTFEAFNDSWMTCLKTIFATQPAWSDIQCILLAGGADGQILRDMTIPIGNVTVLERPIDPSSLMSAVQVALRARRRQYEVRALLEAAEKARQDAEMQQVHIEALNERLQRAMTETHHRVKNNLQIIAAMVDMRAMDDAEMVPTEEFRQLGRHIRVLAAVHDLLTQQAKRDGQAHSVSARDVLQKLLPMIEQTAGSKSVVFSLDEARLSVRQSTSLAIIVNELVSNAIKYGNHDVHVSLAKIDGHALLQIRDDGRGFGPNFNPSTAANTGLELVVHLTRWDLGGEITFGDALDGGGLVCVRMPLHS